VRVDHLRARRHRGRSAADRGDAIALDDHGCVGHHGAALAVEQLRVRDRELAPGRAVRELDGEPGLARGEPRVVVGDQRGDRRLGAAANDRGPRRHRGERIVVLVEPGQVRREAETGDRDPAQPALDPRDLDLAHRIVVDPRLARRQQLDPVARRAEQRADQHRVDGVLHRHVVRRAARRLAVLARRLPGQHPAGIVEPLVDRRFQVVVTGDVELARHAGGVEHHLAPEVGAAAAVVEREVADSLAVGSTRSSALPAGRPTVITENSSDCAPPGARGGAAGPQPATPPTRNVHTARLRIRLRLHGRASPTTRQGRDTRRCPRLQRKADGEVDHPGLLAPATMRSGWAGRAPARVVARHRLQLGAVVGTAEQEQPTPSSTTR